MAYNNQVPEITKEKNYLTSTPIFTWYNEKSAVFNLLIAPNGTLAISMSPSMLKGQNVGKQHVVEKGTKVYDYSQEAYSSLTYQDAIQIRDYMMPHANPMNFAILNGVCGILSDVVSKNPNMQGTLNYMSNVINKINSKSPIEKGVSIFRLKGTAVPKTWNFNFSASQDGRELLYVSCTKNNDKNSRIYTALGEGAFVPFYHALESYINNIAIIQFFASMITYEDAELQIAKVGIFKQLIGDIYGKDLERCANPSDKNMMSTISQGMTEALLKSMMSSKNLRAYTGAPATHKSNQQYSDYNNQRSNGGVAGYEGISSSEIPY